jgi:hypothetical protein
MAKMLRRTYVTPAGEVEYTMRERLDAFANLERCREEEDRRGNQWVTFGVTLARRLEQNRQKDSFAHRVVEHWVPRDSPYWVSFVS